MGINQFLQKIIKLNPTVDFSCIIERMSKQNNDDDLPVSFYHGSFLDITNIAILNDIAKHSCWWLGSDIVNFARQALNGIFIHTDIGQAHHVLQDLLSISKQPILIDRFSPINYNSFYIKEAYLQYNNRKKVRRNGMANKNAQVRVSPIRIFDGSESYLVNKWNHMENTIASYDENTPHAYLINFTFEEKHRQASGEWSNLTACVLLLEMDTCIAAKMLNENNIPIYSSYEVDLSDGRISTMPFPICDAKYIMNDTSCAVSYAIGYSNNDFCKTYKMPIIVSANYRDEKYKFLGMAGNYQQSIWIITDDDIHNKDAAYNMRQILKCGIADKDICGWPVNTSLRNVILIFKK